MHSLEVVMGSKVSQREVNRDRLIKTNISNHDLKVT